MDDLFIFLTTEVASGATFIAACIGLAVYAVVIRKVEVAQYFVLGMLLTIVSVAYLKSLLQMPRPVDPLIVIDGYGMPSGHATAAMFLAVGLYVTFVRAWGPRARYVYAFGALLGVALIGYSRVYYGVHTPLQVAAGFVLGLTVALFLAHLLLRTK